VERLTFMLPPACPARGMLCPWHCPSIAAGQGRSAVALLRLVPEGIVSKSQQATKRLSEALPWSKLGATVWSSLSD